MQLRWLLQVVLLRKSFEELISEMLDHCTNEASVVCVKSKIKKTGHEKTAGQRISDCQKVTQAEEGETSTQYKEAINQIEYPELDSESDFIDDNFEKTCGVVKDSLAKCDQESSTSSVTIAKSGKPVSLAAKEDLSPCIENVSALQPAVETVVANENVSVVYNFEGTSSIPCEEATAVRNADIDYVSGYNGASSNDKRTEINEQSKASPKCKNTLVPNDESVKLPDEGLPVSKACSFEETADDEEVTIFIEFDAEEGVISIDSNAEACGKNGSEISSLGMLTSKEGVGEEKFSEPESIDVMQNTPHCHLYFL